MVVAYQGSSIPLVSNTINSAINELEESGRRKNPNSTRDRVACLCYKSDLRLLQHVESYHRSVF